MCYTLTKESSGLFSLSHFKLVKTGEIEKSGFSQQIEIVVYTTRQD
jgi:hypothetical protein